MTEQTTTSSGMDLNSMHQVVSVKAPPAISWRVFTEKMGTWWPLVNYKIGKAKAVDAVIEPRVGGRWYERGDDGSTCDWGRVLTWEPHSRLVLSIGVSTALEHDVTRCAESSTLKATGVACSRCSRVLPRPEQEPRTWTRSKCFSSRGCSPSRTSALFAASSRLG
jgi:hypothetical protein